MNLREVSCGQLTLDLRPESLCYHQVHHNMSTGLPSLVSPGPLHKAHSVWDVPCYYAVAGLADTVDCTGIGGVGSVMCIRRTKMNLTICHCYVSATQI